MSQILEPDQVEGDVEVDCLIVWAENGEVHYFIATSIEEVDKQLKAIAHLPAKAKKALIISPSGVDEFTQTMAEC